MSNKIQDLEQQILKAWSLKEDISTLSESADWTAIDPVFMDRLLSIACVHEMHMETLWGLYEEVVNEYYAWKPREVNFDNEPVDPLCKICGKVLGSTKECAWTGCPLNWGDESRTDVIGQNGNDGLHYEETKDGS
jgi:hypothetical protein